MMLITGHSEGIGKIIHEHYPGSIGFCRANGVDIATECGRKMIIDNLSRVDIFVNNAFAHVNTTVATDMFAQTELLYQAFTEWRGQHKLIINIGSNTTDGIKKSLWPYSAAKASLDNASEQLCYLKDPCFVTNLRLGYVATRRIKEYAPDEDHMPLEEVTNAIKYILSCYHNGTRVKELCLLP
jgi:NAD(P)-dependent dehydrogenase (short-subunit alcohol dehydrogenase family)